MKTTAELLGEIYRGAELGREVLGRLIKLTEDAELRKEMANQFAEYNELIVEAEGLLAELGKQPPRATALERTPILASLHFNASIDKTSSHLAEMLAQGYVMGLIDATRDLREHVGADECAKELGMKRRATEERNLKTILEYV